MKLTVDVNGNKQLIDAEKITINGVTLENIVKKLIKLEKDLEAQKKKEKQQAEKLKKTWDRMRS